MSLKSRFRLLPAELLANGISFQCYINQSPLWDEMFDIEMESKVDTTLLTFTQWLREISKILS